MHKDLLPPSGCKQKIQPSRRNFVSALHHCFHGTDGNPVPVSSSGTLPSVPKKCHISPQSELNQQRLLGIAATNLRPSKTQTFYQLRHISASPGPAAVAQPREPLGVAVMPCNKQVFGDPSLSLTAEILLTAPRVNPDPF